MKEQEEKDNEGDDAGESNEADDDSIGGLFGWEWNPSLAVTAMWTVYFLRRRRR
jgi:hypothetical protein